MGADLLLAGFPWDPLRCRPVGRATILQLPLTTAALLAVVDAIASPPPNSPDPVVGQELAPYDPTWVHDTARVLPHAHEPQAYRFQLHGEYQLRLRGQTAPRLRSLPGHAAVSDFGQTTRLVHWLRTNPRVDLGSHVSVVGQLDLPRGFVAGQPTVGVDAAREPYDTPRPFQLDPRWLYVEIASENFAVRIGQQPVHWGIGLVENDGDHPPRWGDLEGGTRTDRVQATWYGRGPTPHVAFTLAGDIVFSDPRADLRDGDLATRASASMEAGDRDTSFGLLAVLRRQTAPRAGSDDRTELRELLLDSTGHFAQPIVGSRGYVFGSFEAALVFGDSTHTLLASQTDPEKRLATFGLGAVAQLGAVLPHRSRQRTYGRLVVDLEWGWASGDADPYDGVDRRFAFAPSHNVGLILFDELIAWKTARAATIGQDPAVGERPRPEADGLPTNGAVAGATYLQPEIVFRPLANLDLYAALVVAQTTADFVDPVQVYATGRYQNYDGGPPGSRDLGTEVDMGLDVRVPSCTGVTIQVGGQAGVLFPGNAFADAQGHRLNPQSAGVARLGLQY